MGSPLGPMLANIFFDIMKKFDFRLVLLNLNLLSIEGTLMIHSYFLLEKSHQKFRNYLNRQHKKISHSLLRLKMETRSYLSLTLK